MILLSCCYSKTYFLPAHHHYFLCGGNFDFGDHLHQEKQIRVRIFKQAKQDFVFIGEISLFGTVLSVTVFVILKNFIMHVYACVYVWFYPFSQANPFSTSCPFFELIFVLFLLCFFVLLFAPYFYFLRSSSSLDYTSIHHFFDNISQRYLLFSQYFLKIILLLFYSGSFLLSFSLSVSHHLEGNSLRAYWKLVILTLAVCE